MKKNLLIIDDHIDTCQSIRMILELDGYNCVDFQEGPSALEYLEKGSVHAVLLDLSLGEGQMSGMDVLEKIKKIDASLPVIILTGDTTIRMAVEAMKTGAYHYITKPFDNEEMGILVKKAVDEREKSHQMEILKARSSPFNVPIISGKSRVIRESLELVKKNRTDGNDRCDPG